MYKALVMTCLVAASSGLAQPIVFAPRLPGLVVAAASTAADADEAKKFFQWAQKLYKAGSFKEAIAKFEEAYRLKPHPVIYYNIGRCYEQLGELPKALRNYRDYLRLMPQAVDRESVTDAIANLERRLKEKGVQQMMVFAEPEGARVAIDGREIGGAPITVELTGGDHQLVVTAKGFQKVERSFVMSSTKSMELTIVLKPEGTAPAKPAEVAAAPAPTPAATPAIPPKEKPAPAEVASKPPADTTTKTRTVTASTAPLSATSPTEAVAPAPAPRKAGRLWTFVAGGVAVAGAGAGAVLGLQSSGTIDKMWNNPGRTKAEADAAVSQAAGMATGANVAYGCAGVAAVAAVVLFFVEGKAPAPTAALSGGGTPAAALTF